MVWKDWGSKGPFRVGKVELHGPGRPPDGVPAYRVPNVGLDPGLEVRHPPGVSSQFSDGRRLDTPREFGTGEGTVDVWSLELVDDAC